MDRMEWLLLAVSAGLVLACGVFVAAEFSFVTVDRSSVEKAAAAGDKGAGTSGGTGTTTSSSTGESAA